MKIVSCRQKKERDPFITLDILRTVLVALMIGLTVLAAVKNPDKFLKMRDRYNKLTEKNYDIAGIIDENAAYIFAKIYEHNGDNEADETSTAGGTAYLLNNTEETVFSEEEDSTAKSEAEEVPAVPVVGPVTSDYGSRIHPIYNTESFHSGRDIAADEGTDICAALGGEVIAVGKGQNSGNYIKISHKNGVETLYCHCSEIYAKEGDTVKRGDVIAAVGHTGLATGPHLHFEVHINGQLEDPAVLLDKAENVY